MRLALERYQSYSPWLFVDNWNSNVILIVIFTSNFCQIKIVFLRGLEVILLMRNNTRNWQKWIPDIMVLQLGLLLSHHSYSVNMWLFPFLIIDYLKTGGLFDAWHTLTIWCLCLSRQEIRLHKSTSPSRQ